MLVGFHKIIQNARLLFEKKKLLIDLWKAYSQAEFLWVKIKLWTIFLCGTNYGN